MSEPELPTLAQAASLLLIALPFLLLALRAANALLPRRPRPLHRWRLGEVLAVIGAPFVLSALLGRWLDSPDPLRLLLANELVFGLIAVLAIALAARRPEGLAGLGLTVPPTLRALVAVVSVFVPLFPFVLALELLWQHVCRAFDWADQQEIVQMILGLEGPRLVTAAVVAIVLGPFLEELLFRGFLQGLLVQIAGERLALVVASALFASLHGVASLPGLFALSLFLGWLQLRTRSLFVPWAAHGLNNGVMLALALASERV